METKPFSISIEEMDGMRIWELDDIPKPMNVVGGTAQYVGQKYVEQLMKKVNQKAFMDHEEWFLDPLFSIFQSSLEQGIVDEGTVNWNGRSNFTRISWTCYSWKLPQEIKRRVVQIEISKAEEGAPVGTMEIPLTKIANDGGDILISPRIVSKLGLKKGNTVNVKMMFSS